MRPLLRWLSALLWAGSWYLMYKEVFHWRHLTKTLRFNPPTDHPSAFGQPHPGLPLQALRITAVLAPVTFLITLRRR